MYNRAFTLTVQTPEGTLFEGEVTSVRTMTELGQIQVLAKHASFLTSIQYSRLILNQASGEEDTFILRRGLLTFDNDKNSATILAEYCQKQSEVNVESIHDYLAFIESELAKGNNLSNVQLVYLEDEKFAVKKLINQ